MSDKEKNMKVLIVDDESDNLKVLYNTLVNEGYELSVVKTGKQALNHIPQHFPDLVLLDIILPDIDGYEICQRLKENEATKNIPVIFLSAKLDSVDIIKGFDSGALDYITKPFAQAEVLARVKNHLTIKTLHEELEHRVQQRTEALLMAKDFAEAANQAKSTFLSRMSHELRTPLHAITGFAQLQQKTMPKNASDEHKVMPDRILEAGQHLLMLITDILNMTNNDQGEIDVSITACSIDQIIEESVNLVKKLADDEGITIIKYKPSKLCVKANHGRMKQVFVNLLSNAVKFNHPGGTVSITTCSVADHEVSISVQDTGWGIPTKDLEVIFEPFHRSASAEAKKIQGTGIGLALTKVLVQQMHGSIRVNSEVGKGSTFLIILPKAMPADVPEPIQQKCPHPEPRQVSNRTVLYIEDDPVSLALFGAFINTCDNINFLTARSAEEGIDIAEHTLPSLIFLDINLPNMNGIQAAKHIKANVLLSQTKLIALSADAMPEIINLAKEAGFDQYLTKPLDFEKIMTIIDSL